MSKNIITEKRFATLANCAASGAAGSDLILVEVATGTSHNGTIVLTVNAAASSDAMRNIQVWTSSRSDFATSTSALAAIASDGLYQLTITSDAQGKNLLKANGTTNGSISDLTVSSNTIASIDQDGMYVIDVKNVSKYVNVQYDSSGAGSVISATFIGDSLEDAPYSSDRTAF